MNSEEKYFNAATREILGALSITKPTKEQMRIISDLISNAWLKRSVLFAKPLSNKLIMCLRLAAEGLTASEIAKKMKISPGTVRNYEKEIIQKLQVRNMKQAIATGVRYGALPFLEEKI